MVEILVFVAIAVSVIILVWRLLQQIALAEPAMRISTIVIVVAVAILAILLLLPLAGQGPPLRLWH